MLRNVCLATAAIVALAGTSCTSPKLLLDDHAGELHRARTVATAFYADFGTELGLRDIPFVTVGVEGGTGYSYDLAHNVLFITPHAHAEFDTQRFFARASAGGDGDATYNALLFEYFTAHQLMHLLYDRLPLAPVPQYEEELRINVLTWVFLRKHGLSTDRPAQWLPTLANLEAQLVARFGEPGSGDRLARALGVDTNASYWYVTAVSIQDAYRRAEAFPTERAFVASLVADPVAAAQ